MSSPATLVIQGQVIDRGKYLTLSGSVQLESLRYGRVQFLSGITKIRPRPVPNSPDGTCGIGTFTMTGTLDLTNNACVLPSGPGSSSSTIRQYLKEGHIISSLADDTHRIGYGDNLVLGFTTFAGLPVVPNCHLLMYTYAGDANLDGKVDISDLSALATAWQNWGTWIEGDFNYDGFIDISDLAQLATNWQAGVVNPLADDSLSQALAELRLPAVEIPEPAVDLVPGSLAAAALTTRRSRRRTISAPAA